MAPEHARPGWHVKPGSVNRTTSPAAMGIWPVSVSASADAAPTSGFPKVSTGVVVKDLMQGAEFRVHGSGCRVQGAGFRVQGLGLRV